MEETVKKTKAPAKPKSSETAETATKKVAKKTTAVARGQATSKSSEDRGGYSAASTR